MDAVISFMVCHMLLTSSVLFVYVSLQLSGFKKVVNYTKKVMEDVRFRKAVSREEVIFVFCSHQTEIFFFK
jgi:hypothetical protein